MSAIRIYDAYLRAADDTRKFARDDQAAKLVALLVEERDKAIGVLSGKPFREALYSTTTILADVGASYSRSCLDSIWSGWRSFELEPHAMCPPELQGWLTAFVGAAKGLSLSVTLSDMSAGGNVLIYVNSAYCGLTGYSAEEVLGRNCRLLQGPETEPESVAKIVAGLRSGTDTCVRITNYRKSGEKFENLLLLRPVRDSNAVRRFCVGVQTEVTDQVALSTRLQLAIATAALMPTTIEYCCSVIPSCREKMTSLGQPDGKTWLQRAQDALYAGANAKQRVSADNNGSEQQSIEVCESDAAQDSFALATPVEADLYSRICWSRYRSPDLIRGLLMLPQGEDALRMHAQSCVDSNRIDFCSAAAHLLEEEARALIKAADAEFKIAERERARADELAGKIESMQAR